MSEIIEQIKTVTLEAHQKCWYGNGYLAVFNYANIGGQNYPVEYVPFEGMSDMIDGTSKEDGTPNYHGINSLRQALRHGGGAGKGFDWGSTPLGENHQFVHFCADEDDEKLDLHLGLKAMGLTIIAPIPEEERSDFQKLQASIGLTPRYKARVMSMSDFLVPYTWAFFSPLEIHIVQELFTIYNQLKQNNVTHLPDGTAIEEATLEELREAVKT